MPQKINSHNAGQSNTGVGSGGTGGGGTQNDDQEMFAPATQQLSAGQQH